jgi:glycosyltransferase involved in cell wall biosynthesis
MLGPINTPHTEALALGARDRGFDVVVAGDDWGVTPAGALAEHGIEVSVPGWPTARWLPELMRRVQPDVIHANWFTDAFRYLLYGAVPMVAMAWGSDVYRANRVGRVTNRFVARFAGMVMADSSDLLNQLIRLGASPDRAALLNWGIDLERFSAPCVNRAELRLNLGLPPGRLIISPRALTDVYNPQTIIDAFELVADQHGDVSLLLKHLGADQPDLSQRRHRDRIHTVGYVPYERMADYYQASDVCVSIPTSDSSPRSVWEALGCGCPCVLSDLPWAHELIADGRDALLVPIDVRAVAHAIQRVLEEPQLSADLAANGRALVVEHRDRRKELDRLADIYYRVAAERPGASRAARTLHSSAAHLGEAIAIGRRRLNHRAGADSQGAQTF